MNAKNWSIALCTSAIAIITAVSPARSETVEVTGNNVNIRSGPGTNYSVITVWNKGVQGNRIKQDGAWSYVVTGRVEGWISNAYIKPASTSGASTYEGIGRIDNARYQGSGIAEVKVNGNNATVQVSARGENIRPFSTIYYGSIYSNNGTLMRVSLNAFESTRTGTKFSTTGECQFTLNTQRVRSVTCRAAGVDHGRTVFNSL
ncbi:SH3 domain-containing protein [Cyanobacteria bacterium FACHB-63]|nr:SH3 domain-containing protein [Cyanobacteria bacterium FACHB-63]